MEDIRQLTLGVALSEGHRFDNFLPGRNSALLHALKGLVESGTGGPLVFLWGGPGSGKTHLLEAACAQAAEDGRPTAYVPLATREALDPAMLAGLDNATLICIDDVQRIAGDRVWEEALFHLYNQAEAGGVPMVAAADRPPRRIGFTLGDLKSRLSHGVVFETNVLDDAGRSRVLEVRARARGFEFPKEALSYLMSRGPRDMHSLMALLDQLDALSLREKRKITLPLVRQVLLKH